MFECLNCSVPHNERCIAFDAENDCRMQRVVEKPPDLLAYSAEAVMRELIKVQHPHKVL